MKYGKDGPFEDPVVRCDSCAKLIRTETLRGLGSCECGNRKVRNLLVFNDAERAQMVEWGVDPDFLALFGEHKDAA